MEQILNDIYYNAETGFSSVKSLHDRTKELKHNFTFKSVKEWYSKQSTNQIFTEKRIENDYIPIKCPSGELGCLQTDLLDISKYSGQNKGNTFLLCIIDITTKYAFVYPIKNKFTTTIAPLVEKTILEIKKTYPENQLTMTTDEGGEFLGDVSKVLKKYNIKHYKSLYKNNTAIVERFHKTLWGKIKRYTQSKKKLSFIDVIQQLIKNYNSTIHTSLSGLTPTEAYNKTFYLPPDIRPIPKDKIEIGMKVRHAIKKEIFDKKSFVNKYSRETYIVVGKQGNRYQLAKSLEGEKLKTEYLPRELKVVGEVEEEVIREGVKRSGTTERGGDNEERGIDKQLKKIKKARVQNKQKNEMKYFSKTHTEQAIPKEATRVIKSTEKGTTVKRNQKTTPELKLSTTQTKHITPLLNKREIQKTLKVLEMKKK
jgi:hypothetical protein